VGVALLRDQGRLLVLSSPRSATSFDFHDLCNRRSLTIVGAHGFSHPPIETGDNPWTGRRHGELFLSWLEAGWLTVAELVSHRFPAERASDAYRFLSERRDEAMAVVLDWT
jgi:threonine dehydrogenase-like Zn-dependent dehydrogenase